MSSLEATDAKMTAFRDITEDLRKQRKALGVSAWSEFAPVNYIYHEADICASLGIPTPDFRKFNGGYHPKKK